MSLPDWELVSIYDTFHSAALAMAELAECYGHILIGAQEYKLLRNPDFYSQRIYAMIGDSILKCRVMEFYASKHSLIMHKMSPESVHRSVQIVCQNDNLRDFAKFILSHHTDFGLFTTDPIVLKLRSLSSNERSMGTFIEALIGICEHSDILDCEDRELIEKKISSIVSSLVYFAERTPYLTDVVNVGVYESHRRQEKLFENTRDEFEETIDSKRDSRWDSEYPQSMLID